MVVEGSMVLEMFVVLQTLMMLDQRVFVESISVFLKCEWFWKREWC